MSDGAGQFRVGEHALCWLILLRTHHLKALSDVIQWARHLPRRLRTRRKRGRDKGLNVDLLVSSEIARLTVDYARDGDKRGMAQNNLGNALWKLGERESGTARLEEAVAAYRSALEERTRERVPLDWAATQNNLGNPLWKLGERESGTARLEEAVAAYRSALEERTRERVPLDWAATQNNLGNALRTLGERESGTARLEEAVAVYRAALEEWTRERVPLNWAATQNNLGVTRDEILARVRRGETSTETAEQWAAENGEIFSTKPDPARFDPMTEPHWTLPMAYGAGSSFPPSPSRSRSTRWNVPP